MSGFPYSGSVIGQIDWTGGILDRLLYVICALSAEFVLNILNMVQSCLV